MSVFRVGGSRSWPMEIGAMKYMLKMKEGVIDRGLAHYGQHDPGALELLVDSLQPTQRQVAAVLHESLHALNAQSRNELEEAQIEVLALQFMGFMKDNPELMEEMAEALGV